MNLEDLQSHFSTTKEFYLTVKVNTKAQKTELRDIFSDPEGNPILKINIHAPREKGKANAELVRFLDELFSAEVVITSGLTASMKRVKIRRI